jgi:hypothetical protein
MSQYTQDEVSRKLAPYHARIHDVVRRGYEEWVAVKQFMASSGHGSVLYPRTIANHVFDAVVRQALDEFGDDPDIRVVDESQTVKFCFGDVVLARFKKGDEDNLGQNQPTQAVMDFVSAQNEFPGLPPSATKIEILYAVNAVEDHIKQVVVAARDGSTRLWYYELEGDQEPNSIVSFPQPLPPADEDDGDEKIVVIRKQKDDTSENEAD